MRSTVALFEAARQTGVERVVHVSIHQPVPGQHVAVVGLIVAIPPSVALLVARLIGLVERDVFLTRKEIHGLMAGLFESRAPANGTFLYPLMSARMLPSASLNHAVLKSPNACTSPFWVSPGRS